MNCRYKGTASDLVKDAGGRGTKYQNLRPVGTQWGPTTGDGGPGVSERNSID